MNAKYVAYFKQAGAGSGECQGSGNSPEAAIEEMRAAKLQAEVTRLRHELEAERSEREKLADIIDHAAATLRDDFFDKRVGNALAILEAPDE